MVVVWPLLPAARVSVSTGKMEQTWAGRLSGSGWRVVYWEDGSQGERREKWLQWQRAKTWRKDGSATTGSNSGSDSSNNNNNNNNKKNTEREGVSRRGGRGGSIITGQGCCSSSLHP